MTTYYSKELQRPLTEFALRPEENTINIQVHSNDVKTKHLSVNLESIDDFRAMLDVIEEVLNEAKIGGY